MDNVHARRAARNALRHAAVHEAGHAVAKSVFGIEYPGVYIRPDETGECEGTGKSVMLDRYAVEADVLVTLAGPVAEARSRRCSLAFAIMFGGSNDFEKAKTRVDHLVSLPYFGKTRDQANAHFEEWTREFVRDHWPKIQTVADALMNSQRLTSDEVAALIEPRGH